MRQEVTALHTLSRAVKRSLSLSSKLCRTRYCRLYSLLLVNYLFCDAQIEWSQLAGDKRNKSFIVCMHFLFCLSRFITERCYLVNLLSIAGVRCSPFYLYWLLQIEFLVVLLVSLYCMSIKDWPKNMDIHLLSWDDISTHA